MRGLLRIRNVLVVIVPAVALTAAAIASSIGLAWPDNGVGAMAVALAPAPLAGPGLLLRTGRRGDLAGALVIGTVVLSFVSLVSGWLVPSGQVVMSSQAFVFAAVIASAVPTIRDRILAPLRWLGWLSFAGVLVWTAAIAAIDARVVVAALVALAVGAGAAALAARVLSRDVPAAVAGAGLRDPAIAAALAFTVGGPSAAAVPVVYGVLCLGIAALALRAR